MDLFVQLFEHLPAIQVVVCRPCAIAVPPLQILGHLKKHHPKVPAARRGDVAAVAQTLSNLAWEPEDVCALQPAQEAITSLKLQGDGLVCTAKGCRYTCTTLRGIQGHCRDKHAWTNIQKRGGDVRQKSQHSSNRLWKDNQPCQRLFRAVGWPAYMAVEASAVNNTVQDLSQLAKADLLRAREEDKAAAGDKTVQEFSRYQANAWLELTEWVPHLKGLPRAELLRARRLPGSTEDDQQRSSVEDCELDLADTCKALQRLVRKAFRSSRLTHRPVREIIERREAGAQSNEKPFYCGHKVSTIKKYTQRLTQIVCYLWRTHDQRVRPPYKLTVRQSAALCSLQRVAQSADTDRQARLEKGCMELWIALLDHELLGNEHDSPLLSSIAVLGLKEEHHGGGWVPAHEFSPALSALITTSKALVIHYAQCQHDKALLEGASAATPMQQLVSDMAERFMTLSTYKNAPTPMNRMLRLRTLARTEGMKHNTAGIVAWDGDRLLINKQSFALNDLRSMIKGLCETARMQLLKDVLLLDLDERDSVRPGTTPLPELSIDKLLDTPAELAVGWSFLKHPSNGLEGWTDWLYDRVRTEAPLRERFMGGVDNTQQPARVLWRDSAVSEYMRKARRFKEILFVLVHLSGGGPGRGTEITSIQCENSADGVGYRGVFAEGGLLSFTTNYHKGYSFKKRVMVVHRYVPREVSELVVYFLGLGRPFINTLQRLHNGVTKHTSFLWEPKPEEQWEDDDDDGDEGSDSNSSVSGDSDDETEQVSQQKLKSSNPDGYWGTDRIRRVLREQTLSYMGAALGTSSWRHSYPAIHRELAKDGQARDFVEALYYGKEFVVDEEARAKQLGHGFKTEEGSYGRSMKESPLQTMAERENFRRVSIDWHRVLQFASVWIDGRMHPGVRAEAMWQHKRQSLQRWSTLAATDLKPEFQRLVGNPEAKYRGKQEECLQAIVQRKLRVLAVMGTGTGKSMLFMLPASLTPGGVTIVIAPLNALRDSLQDRCDELGIPCAKWDGRRPPYWARIVLITPESAVTDAFSRFVDEKRMLEQLDRIVIDECHVLLESSATWRPDVLKLTEMTEKGTQVIYLTATLPPTLQPAFLHAAALDQMTLTVCRDERTTRTNIAYHVHDYKRGTLDDTLVALIAAKREKYGPKAQILVFCTTVDETKRLGKFLSCSAYWREMATDDEKARMVRRFTSGLEKLCTATSLLSLGIDAPGVRVVIHVSMSRQVLHFVQESGRAGRTGAPSEAIVLRAHWQTKSGQEEKWSGYKLDSPAKEFLSTDTCRRIPIDRHMDGRQDRERCEAGEAKCDLCKQCPRGAKRRVEDEVPGQLLTAVAAAEAEQARFKRTLAIDEQKVEIQLRRRREKAQYSLERLQEHFGRWKDVCIICMAVEAKSASHKWEVCPNASEAQIHAIEMSIKWTHGVKWAAFARCNYCWAPQAMCNRWEETSSPDVFQRRTNAYCQWDRVLQHAVAALLALQRPACQQWLEQQLRNQAVAGADHNKRLQAWLGQKTKISEKSASYMCRLLYAWEEGHVHSGR